MINFDLKPDRIKEKCRKWDYEIIQQNFGKVDKNYIPMWIADMDFIVPKEIREKFIQAIDRGVFGYTYCYEEFYNAVIDWQRDMHNVYVNKEEIILTYGTVSTLHYVVQAFYDEGDSIIINTPVYEPFDSSAKKQGVNVIYNKLDIIKNRYYINYDLLDNQINKYRPKLMFLCSPHNPSGRIWSYDELKKVAQICNDNNIILVVDEVHAEYVFEGEFKSILTLDKDLIKNVVLLTSPNKAFNLGGLKTSYAIIKNDYIREIFKNKLKQNSVTSPNVFGVIALITAYNECRYWIEDVRNYIRDNYIILEKWISKNKRLSMMKMESSFLVWLNIEKLGIDSSEVTKILARDYGLLVEDGKHFVDNGEKFIRINLGTQRENVEKMINKMECFIKKLE